MAGGVLEPDAVVRGDLVERVAVRVAAGLVLVVAGAADPVPVRGGRRAFGDPRVQLVQAGDAAVDVAEREPEADHVVVRVVETGDQRGALEVDDVVRGGVRLAVVDGGDPAAGDGDGAGPRV